MNQTLQSVYLARHDETAWTISGQHTGLTDLPLTQRGERNARRLEERPRGLFRDACPGGESPANVGVRADRAIKHLRDIEGNVLLFSSTHFLRVFAARWLGLEFGLQLPRKIHARKEK